MTDDARSVIRAFSDAPVMTLQAVSTMAGLGEHTTRFILVQLRQAGIVLEMHELWRMTEGASTIRESAFYAFNSER